MDQYPKITEPMKIKSKQLKMDPKLHKYLPMNNQIDNNSETRIVTLESKQNKERDGTILAQNGPSTPKRWSQYKAIMPNIHSKEIETSPQISTNTYKIPKKNRRILNRFNQEPPRFLKQNQKKKKKKRGCTQEISAQTCEIPTQ